MTDYSEAVRKRIEVVLRERKTTLPELVRSCRGAYPGIVTQELQAFESGIMRSCEAVYQLIRSPLSEWKSGLSHIESNPVLSTWYFTEQTCERICSLRDWAGQRIAFLGTPKLFERFSQSELGRERILLDLDSLVLETLVRVAKEPYDSVYLYDVQSEIPSDLLGKFDCVFFDPPWYPDDYSLWLRRAAELAPDGTVVFPLFQELTRPTASSERDGILGKLARCKRNPFLLTDFVQYETPSFERAQLHWLGLAEIADDSWRSADLVIGTADYDLEDITSNQEDTLGTWSEVRLGSMRVFVNSVTSADEAGLLVPASVDGSLILKSPSRRDSGRLRANVLTSRGHGLRTSRPSTLLLKLRELANGVAKDHNIGTAIQALAIDKGAQQILTTILEE